MGGAKWPTRDIGIEDMWQDILNWTQAHTEWAVPVVFAFAFLESLIVISLFVPGWLLLVGMGSLVGAGVLPFYPVVIAAYCGAVIGESLGFWVGARHAEWVRQAKFSTENRALLDRAASVFQRYGVASLVVGRFIGPIRAVLPFVAGVMHFPWRWFLATNLLSGLLWAPAYLLPGMLIGASFNIPLSTLWPLAFHLAMIVALIWVLYRLLPGYRRSAMVVGSLIVGLVLVLPFTHYWSVFLQVVRQLSTVVDGF